MHYGVVGCSIFRNEIEYLEPHLRSKLDFYWLPQKLHNKPLELRRLIQDEVDKIDGSGKPYDAILLLYGLCSKGTIGISSKRYPLIIPRVQDCISMLLGSSERYARHFREKPGTYWFTKGWIETGFDPGRNSGIDGVFDPYREKFLEYRKKFNEEISKYLIHEWDQRWIRNYTTVAYIDWGMAESGEYRERACKSAESLGLEFEDIKGDPGLLTDLLNGKWDQERYLRVEPGFKIIPSYNDSVLACTEGLAEKGLKWSTARGKSKKSERKRSGIGLGIDAGGTYTDTVLYDFTREEVIASAKAPTTHDDYTVGIKNSLLSLLEHIPDGVVEKIGLVALSTTLATNAIVEGKGGRVGLILIGYDVHSLRKVDVRPKVVIKGKHNIEGELTEPLDVREAKDAIENLLKDGVDVFAVSSEVGARNPEHELQVKELIRETSDLPVVCASELTVELNCVKRANTCFLNARLIPLVASLLSSVKKVLSERGINAPVMVVKGDGTLMGEEIALVNPIEMILSGPAASVIGGAYLSNIQDGYVVDMGGTTTDMASIKDGFVSFKDNGISINGFRTAVKTVNVHTFGLGGDSYIRFDDRIKKIQIGPQRVIPISYLAHMHPDILTYFKKKRELRGEELLVQPADFFIFQKEFRGEGLHPQESAIIQVLKEHGPMSRVALAQRVNAVSVSLIRTERLETFGNILRAALTPTDVLHAIGAISFWSRDAASSAVSLYAQRAGMHIEALIEGVLKEFYRNLLFHLFEFWFTEDGRLQGEREFSANLASHLFFHIKDVHLNAKVHKPVVFIGAPARKYAEGIENLIGAQVIVPTFHEVANAVGSITGSIREDVTILIRPTIEGGFIAYTPGAKRFFATLSEAKEEMMKLAEKTAVQKAKLSGALHLNVNIDVKDKEVRVSADDIIYLETIVTASVTSVPTPKV